MKPLVVLENLTRIFDVSKPWLNRLIERLPRALLTAVSDVSLTIEEKSVYALVGGKRVGKVDHWQDGGRPVATIWRQR